MLVPEQTVSITTAGQGRENAQVCHVDVTTSHSFGLYETFAEKQNHGNFPELISYMNALNWHDHNDIQRCCHCDVHVNVI